MKKNISRIEKESEKNISQKTDYRVDLNRLISEWKSIVPPDNRYGQVSVQYSLYCENKYIDSCGKFRSNGKDAIQDRFPEIDNESHYNLINDLYENTLFDKILCDWEGVRARLMTIKPKSSYTVHTDITSRYHLALDTNPHAYFIFPEGQPQLFHIPPDGHVYHINTTEPHSFVNCGTEPRTHLVFS